MLASIKGLFVVLASSAVCLTALPAESATLLKGYVSQDEQSPEASQAAQPAASPAIQPPIGMFAPDSCPAGYAGKWHCLTVVTDSAVDSVSAGQQLSSEIQFDQTAGGRIVARWNQPGWVESKSTITTWNASESMIDRTSYYYGEGLKGSWAARSRDRFTQIGKDQMVAQSYIDQYVDGQYLGRYRTKSVLVRQSSDDVALNTP